MLDGISLICTVWRTPKSLYRNVSGFSDEREPYIKNLSGNNNSEIMSFESETAN